MKKLVLKENRVTYDAGLERSLREGESVIIEHEGRAVAAMVPMEEYEAFRAWKATQQRDLPRLRPANWTLEELVADIKRRGPGVPNFREATASLAEALRSAPHDPDFNLEEWNREWTKIEAEIEANDKVS